MKLLSQPEKIYGAWDRSLNPHLITAELFGETVSTHDDERIYNDRVIKFLEDNYELIEYNSVSSYLDILSEEEKLVALAKKRAKNEDNEYPYDFDSKKAKRLFLSKEDKCLIFQVNSDINKNQLSWFYPSSNKLNIDKFSEFIVPEDKEAAKVGVLLQNSNGAMLIKKVSFEAPKIDNIELNYGTGFNETYEKLIDRFSNYSKGIVIMRGCPGSGKSSLIKHLTTKINKQFLFVPVNLCGSLSEPSFLTLLLSQGKDSIIVLEDAEQAIQSREDNPANAAVVATILNLADGILGNLLSCQFLLSYNTKKEWIDRAILRKGRTMLDVNIDVLSIKDSQRLLNHLGKKYTATTSMPLSDIYNLEMETGVLEEKPKVMGFGFAAVNSTK